MRFCSKIGYFLTFSAIFGGCELRTEPEFLAMQAEIGDFLFGNNYAFGYHVRRDFELQSSDDEGNIIRLFLPKIEEGKYALGAASYAEATIIFREYNDQEASSSYNQTGDGEIEVTKINWQDSTISGRFWFDASDALNPDNWIPVQGGIFRGVSIRGAFDNPFFTQPFEVKHLGRKVALRQDQSIAHDPTTNYFTLRAKHASSLNLELRFPDDLTAGQTLNSAAVKSVIGAFFSPETGADSFQEVKSGSFEIIQNDLAARVFEARFSLVLKNLDGSSEERLDNGYFLFNY